MRKLVTFLTAFVFFIPLLAFCEQEGSPSSHFARLSYVKGDVFIQRAADLGYQEGVVNLPIVEGDKLGTKEGRAEIHFGRRNYLRIDSFTQIDFANLPQSENDPFKLHLLSGSIYLRINFLEAEKSFEIHTPDASFYALEEGLYRFHVTEKTESEAFVYEGTLEAAGEEGSLLVKSQEKLVASNGNFTSDSSYFYSSYDDFAQWNGSRDALYAQRISRTYLPSELYEYEEELATNGHWVYERPYGYVWVPYVYVQDWRPYFYGRWTWYPIVGWTWVSDEPWGWSVYHYGRWHWRWSIGWYWIPTSIWGPAWVHWYSGYDYIGWCPLSYYNYPGVLINNYFYDRYYDPYYPAHSRALTVVHKNQLQSPHISRVALDQRSVSSLSKISLSAHQPGIRPITSRSITQNSVAAKVLSRSNVREIGRSFEPNKTFLTPSRLKSSGEKSLPSFSRSQVSREKTSIQSRQIKSSGLEISSRLPSKSKGVLSLRRPQSNEQNPSTFSRIRESREAVKIYPSRRLLPSFSKRNLSPSSSSSSRSSFSSPRQNSKTYPSDSAFSQPERSYSGGYIRQQPRYIERQSIKSGSRGTEFGSSLSSPYRSYSPPSYTPQSRSYTRSNPSFSSRFISPQRSGISPSYRSTSSSRSLSTFSRSISGPSLSQRSSPSRSFSGRISKRNN